jgi:hypothetical protein
MHATNFSHAFSRERPSLSQGRIGRGFLVALTYVLPHDPGNILAVGYRDPGHCRALRGATRRWNDCRWRAARPRGLKRHPPVKLAVGTARELGFATEMEIGLSRITDGPTAIGGLKGSDGLHLLGHDLLGHDDTHAPVGAPPRQLCSEELALPYVVTPMLHCNISIPRRDGALAGSALTPSRHRGANGIADLLVEVAEAGHRQGDYSEP